MNATIALAFAATVILSGCGNPSPHQEQPTSSSATAQTISYAGGDGSSLEHAIVINGAKGEDDGVKSEYAWLRQRYPTYKLVRQSVRKNERRIYDQLDIATPDGDKSVFFEITSFYGK